jgi:hypothetical protein
METKPLHFTHKIDLQRKIRCICYFSDEVAGSVERKRLEELNLIDFFYEILDPFRQYVRVRVHGDSIKCKNEVLIRIAENEIKLAIASKLFYTHPTRISTNL